MLVQMSLKQNNAYGQGGSGPAASIGWLTYKAGDGKTYNYPAWEDVAPEGKVKLQGAIADINLTTGTSLKKATMKIYKSGAIPGYWEATPSLTYVTPANPADGKSVISGPQEVPGIETVRKWSMTWMDSANPPQKIDKGINIKIEVTLTTMANGVESESVSNPTLTTTATHTGP